jgi:hypothetical protein
MQQSPTSNTFHRSCRGPLAKPTSSPIKKLSQRKPPSRLIETIEGNFISKRKPKRVIVH